MHLGQQGIAWRIPYVCAVENSNNDGDYEDDEGSAKEIPRSRFREALGIGCIVSPSWNLLFLAKRRAPTSDRH